MDKNAILLLRKIVSPFLITLIFASTILYSIALVCWMLISFLLPNTVFHKVEDAMWGFYQRMVVFVFEHFTGVEIYIIGEVPSITESALVISNHQCMVDWIVGDFMALRQNVLGHMRFIFKNSLKYLPLYGFAFGVHGGVFVRRDGCHNNRNMKLTLNMLQQRKADIYLMLYPEGTRFSPARKNLLAKSQSFATKAGLKPLNQVLTPRVKAFDCALNSLKTYIKAVYDLTIFYDKPQVYTGNRPEAPHGLSFLWGECKRVYVKFDRIPIDQVVREISALETDKDNSSEDASLKWLHKRFAMKDRLLEQYYSKDSKNILNEMFEAQQVKRSVLPLSSTLPAALCFLLMHALFLYFPWGRYTYCFVSTFGVVACWLYSHLRF